MKNARFSLLKAFSGCMLALMLLAVAARTQPAAAQATSEAPDENTIRMQYSLYYEDWRNGNYQTAMPYLKWILENAPGFPNNNDRNYERILQAYDSLATRAEDPAVARAYRDTVLYYFDTAPVRLQEAGIEVDAYEWKFDKARYIQSHADELPDLQDQVAVLYRELYETDASRLDDYYLNYLIADLVQRGDKEGAIAFMEELESKYPERQAVIDYITQMRNSLFNTPEERMAFLEDQLKKKPGDMEIINELFEIYRELNERQKMYAIAEQLLEMQPTTATYRIIAQMRLNDGEAAEAFELYEKALAMPDAEPRVEDFYNMGIAQQQLGSLAKARTYFRRALDVKSDYGPALIAIGDLYVQAIANCGSFEREDKAVYWLAVDYFQRARSADSSVAASANQKINTYSKYFPTAEEKFFKNWENGQRYTVDYGCYSWINETTTIR